MFKIDPTKHYRPWEIGHVWTSTAFSGATGFPKGLPFTMTDVLEIYSSHMRACAQAHQIMTESAQIMSRGYQEILSQNIETFSKSLQQMMESASPEDKIINHMETMHSNYGRLVNRTRALQDVAQESWREATDMLHQSVLASCHKGALSLRNVDTVCALPAPHKVAA